MDGPLITAFVDRWCPESHSFHQPSGEMSMLMQDVGYILGLRLDGPVVIGMVDTKELEGYGGAVYRPPDPEEGKKEKKTSGVSSAWCGSASTCALPMHGTTLLRGTLMSGCGTWSQAFCF